VAEVKNYGLSGVHRTLQLGKQGPVLVGNADTDSFSVTLQDGATLTNMGGANATTGTHFITKSQLDSVYTEAQFLANVNYNDTSPILLGNISSGTKTIITTFTVSTAFDANAVVTVGTSGNNSLLMSDNYCEIEATGVYQTINTVEFASNTSLSIYVTQGGASAGVGNVLVSVVDGPVVNAGAINYSAGGGGGIDLTDLSVTTNSPSGNGSLTYSNTTGVFTFTPADASLSNYGNSDVVTLLSSFGSNSISTIGNISANAFVLPGGGTITESTYGFAGSIRLKPIGGSATQYLEIAPTAGGDGDHVHLMAGGGTTELFLGDDNQYVKLASNGAIVVNSANVSLGNSAQWTFGIDGNLTLPGNSFTVNYANGSQVSLGGGGIALANLSVSVNSPSGNGSLSYSNSTGVFTFTPADASLSNYGNSNVVTLLGSFGSNTLVTTGNVSAGNVITTGKFVGDGSALTNVTVSVAGNIVGTSQNVSLVAGAFTTTFDNTGNLVLPGNTFAINYANNTPVNVVTKFEGSWTVPVGNSTQSFTVTPGETYYMWVDCNIPNGIISWNATATITNTNVPVVGAQYAWVYNGGGSPIDFTSIPNQFIGTSNTIVRSSVAPSSTTNRFDFGLNNTSGGNITVRYGWIAIS
jgi:hypothetical protein